MEGQFEYSGAFTYLGHDMYTPTYLMRRGLIGPVSKRHRYLIKKLRYSGVIRTSR